MSENRYPVSVVPFRYFAEWSGSEMGADFGTDRTAALAWILEALPARASRAEAEALLVRAEQEGGADLTAWDYAPARVTASQRPVLQGEADDAAAWDAAQAGAEPRFVLSWDRTDGEGGNAGGGIGPVTLDEAAAWLAGNVAGTGWGIRLSEATRGPVTRAARVLASDWKDGAPWEHYVPALLHIEATPAPSGDYAQHADGFYFETRADSAADFGPYSSIDAAEEGVIYSEGVCRRDGYAPRDRYAFVIFEVRAGIRVGRMAPSLTAWAAAGLEGKTAQRAARAGSVIFTAPREGSGADVEQGQRRARRQDQPSPSVSERLSAARDRWDAEDSQCPTCKTTAPRDARGNVTHAPLCASADAIRQDEERRARADAWVAERVASGTLPAAPRGDSEDPMGPAEAALSAFLRSLGITPMTAERLSMLRADAAAERQAEEERRYVTGTLLADVLSKRDREAAAQRGVDAADEDYSSTQAERQSLAAALSVARDARILAEDLEALTVRGQYADGRRVQAQDRAEYIATILGGAVWSGRYSASLLAAVRRVLGVDEHAGE